MSQLNLRVFEDEHEIGRHLAARILEGIEDAAHRNARYVLGCPGGRSLRSTYRALAVAARQRPDIDLSPLTIAMMDDYLETANGGLVQVPANVHFSCRRFAYEEIIGPLAGLPGAPDPDRVWFPNPANPAAYDDLLTDAGAIDLFLLASGASDGHVAFNPPGSDEDSNTRVVKLAETTREDNLHTFPEFAGLSEIPTHGVTIGLGSIVRLSQSAALVCSGKHKRATVRRVLEGQTFDPTWPATIIHHCKAGELLVDRSALGDTSHAGESS
jgi:glucosamine-6-phosphate deaminase